MIILNDVNLLAREYDFQKLETTINNEISAGRAPGVAIAIVKDDKIVYESAFGHSNFDSKQPLTSKHLFRSASTLKMMVGTALAKLATEGKVDLHTPINSYIDGLHPRIGKITAHQLLTHTSGILDESSNDGNTAENALQLAAEDLGESDIFLPPDIVLSYSNPGYSLAGYLIEKVTGKSFRKAMDDLLFTPLGMNRSTFELDKAKAWGMAYPHSGEGSSISVMAPTVTNRAADPSGTLFSTVGDYARYMVAIINGGHIEGKAVIPSKVIEWLSNAQIPLSEMVLSYSYSYGLMVGQYHGQKALFHTGGMPGYASNVMMLPDLKTGIVLFTNGRNLDRNRIIAEAAKAVIELGKSARFNFDVEKGELVTLEEAREIAGRYIQREDLPTISIRIDESKAILKNRGIDYTLYYYPNKNIEGQYVGVSKEGYKFRFRVGRNQQGQPQFVQWWIRAFAKIH